MNTISEETKNKFPNFLANVALALMFWTISQITLVTLNRFNKEFVFLVQTGLLLVAGISLVRSSFEALTIALSAIVLFLKRLGIKEDWPRQRVFKDVIYVVAIILMAATIFPMFRNLSNFGPLLQKITTYAALGLTILFVPAREPSTQLLKKRLTQLQIGFQIYVMRRENNWKISFVRLNS